MGRRERQDLGFGSQELGAQLGREGLQRKRVVEFPQGLSREELLARLGCSPVPKTTVPFPPPPPPRPQAAVIEGVSSLGKGFWGWGWAHGTPERISRCGAVCLLPFPKVFGSEKQC